MAGDDIEKTLIRLEERSWQANISEDAGYFLEATSEEILVVMPFGVFDRRAIVGQIEKKLGAPFKSAHMEDPRVMVLTPDSALITYKVVIVAVVQGKDVRLPRYVTSVYVKRNGIWKTAFSQQTDTK